MKEKITKPIDVLKTSPLQEKVEFKKNDESMFKEDKNSGHLYSEKDLITNKDRQNIGVERFVSLLSKGILHTSDIIEKDEKYYSRLNYSHSENSEPAKEGEIESEIFILKYLFGDWDHTIGGWDHDDLDIQDNVYTKNGRFAHFDYGEAFKNTKSMDPKTFPFPFTKNENPEKFVEQIIFILDHPGFIDPSRKPITQEDQYKFNHDRSVNKDLENEILIKATEQEEALKDKDFFNAVIDRAKLDLSNERFSFLSTNSKKERSEELQSILIRRLEVLKSILLNRQSA